MNTLEYICLLLMFMENTDALNVYLNEFYDNPLNLESYKVNFLKNHYYNDLKYILKCEFENFKIGVTKNRNIIW